MFFIISHKERESSLAFNKDIILLNYDKSHSQDDKHKIRSVVNFCKSKNPNDVVLYISCCYSMLLDSKEEILKKYLSMKTGILFSKRRDDRSLAEKYSQDKMFNSCQNARINSNFYIGTTRDIYNLWQDYLNSTEKLTEIVYLNRLCMFNYSTLIKVDTQRQIFFNVELNKNIIFRDNHFFINKNKINSPIIVFNREDKELDSFIKKYKLNNQICKHKNKNISFYSEYILIFLLSLFVFLFKFNPLAILVAFSIFIFYIYYIFQIRFLKLPKTIKAYYYLNLIIHDIVYYAGVIVVLLNLFYIFKWEYSIILVSLLNVLVLTHIVIFTFYKRCIFRFYADKYTKIENISPPPLEELVHYLYNNKPFLEYKGKVDKYKTTHKWLNGERIYFMLTLIINIYFFIRVYFKH